jgi:hypothetical protein
VHGYKLTTTEATATVAYIKEERRREPGMRTWEEVRLGE